MSLLYVAGLIMMVGCSSDEVSQEKPIARKTTAFMMKEAAVTSAAPAGSRTAGTYTGSQLDFFWTANDHLWVNNPSATPALVESSSSNLAEQLVGGVSKVPTAKFWFEGEYTAPSYVVRYTGRNSSAGDKVIISPVQEQQSPAEATQIGMVGDCGTATATYSAAAQHYEFTLDHKAAYLTLLPYSTLYTGEKVSKIKITASSPIAGTFDFTDAGLATTAPQNPSTTITMTLQGNDGSGFPIANAPNRLVNSSTIVLAPGTYSTFDIEYTVTHPISHIQGTVTKHYTNVTFNPGKNKKLNFDLPYPVTPGRYLFEDGTTGTIGEKGSHTIVGVVVREKTATEDGMAVALHSCSVYHLGWQGSRGSDQYTAQQWNNVMYPNFTDAARDMDGYKYTWEGAGSWDGTTVKATSTSPFFSAFNYGTSTTSIENAGAITFAHGKRGKWFVPSVGQMMLAFQVLGNISVLPTMAGQTSGEGDYTYMKNIFNVERTVLFGTLGLVGVPDPEMWTSTQADASHAYSVKAIIDGGYTKISYVIDKAELNHYVGVVNPFIYF